MVAVYNKHTVGFSFLLHIFHLGFLERRDLVLHRFLFPTIFKERRTYAVLHHVLHREDVAAKLWEVDSYLAPAEDWGRVAVSAARTGSLLLAGSILLYVGPWWPCLMLPVLAVQKDIGHQCTLLNKGIIPQCRQSKAKSVFWCENDHENAPDSLFISPQ